MLVGWPGCRKNTGPDFDRIASRRGDRCRKRSPSPASIQYLSLIIAASLYSDKGKFHSDLNAARNVNMSECALNQNSLQLTLNQRLCRNFASRGGDDRAALLSQCIGSVDFRTRQRRVGPELLGSDHRGGDHCSPPEGRNENATNWVKRP